MQNASDVAHIEDPELEEDRVRAESVSSAAFQAANAISKDYLHESNPDLPRVYFAHFVPALDSWRQGLSERNGDLMEKGVLDYNEFILWMQSKDRSDFKPLR